MTSVDVKSFARTVPLRMGTPKEPSPPLDADMEHMLALWRGLGGRGLEGLTAVAARALPALAAAQQRYLRAGEDFGVEMGALQIPGAAGRLEARLYRTRGGNPERHGALILYFHGGGWVTGSLAASEITARALAARTGAQVLAVATRQAPEHRFPAAHEDAVAVWRWLVADGHALGVDPARMAVAGEGSGGNLALNIAIKARDEKSRRPAHLALVTPVAGVGLDTPSHRQNPTALPLGTAAVKWLGQQVFTETKQAYDRRIALSTRPDLAGLPPVTLVLAQNDPLRSDGETLGAALRKAGNTLDLTLYSGVTHDFFGLFRTVNKAMFALGQVSFNLADALGNGP